MQQFLISETSISQFDACTSIIKRKKKIAQAHENKNAALRSLKEVHNKI